MALRKPNPALFSSTSAPPKAWSASATAAAMAGPEVTSSAAVRHVSGYCAARSARSDTCQPVATTWSPRASTASAVAWPKPDEHPVISQVRTRRPACPEAIRPSSCRQPCPNVSSPPGATPISNALMVMEISA